jgi:hypothetical protein
MEQSKLKFKDLNLQETLNESNILLNNVFNLKSFEDVRKWDKSANLIIKKLKTNLIEIEDEIIRLRNLYEVENVNFKSKSVWKRLFDQNPALKVKKRALQLKKMPLDIEVVIEKLESWIERTPDNLDEAKDAIAEFKLYKKELILEKKEINIEARNVREYYSKKNAYTPRGKNGQFARTFNRINKTNKLDNIQDARNEVERKIKYVDETILWIEKIIHNS